jgi:cation transport ATPase
MFVLEAFALSGLLYAGGKALARRRHPPAQRIDALGQAAPLVAAEAAAPAEAGARRKVGRALRVSSVSLALAAAGAVWRLPLLSVASLPAALWVFAPAYGGAWRALRARRVDIHVLDATRMAVCAAMGYTVVAALNALLYAMSQKMFLRAEEDFRATLDDSLGAEQKDIWVYREGAEISIPRERIGPGDIVTLSVGDAAPSSGRVLEGRARVRARLTGAGDREIARGARLAAGSRVVSGKLQLLLEHAPEPPDAARAQLESAVAGDTVFRKLGERNGARMAPWMLAAFALTTPLMGVNRAAAFLTTSFGAQMSRLSPYTARHILGLGVRHGILLRQPRALESALLVNAVIFDARVLSVPAAETVAGTAIRALRKRAWPAAQAPARRFAIHVMAEDEATGQAWAEKLGLDDYFVARSDGEKAEIVQNLQLGGRWVCYVGSGEDDEATMRTALLSVLHRPGGAADELPAQVALAGEDLSALPGLFELAGWFAPREAYNLAFPIGMDLLDISTTVFLHFGLVYSVLMSYFGLFAGAAQARPPKAQLVAAPPEALPALPASLQDDARTVSDRTPMANEKFSSRGRRAGTNNHPSAQ